MGLSSITEELDEHSEDHFGSVEFDLLEAPNSLGIMTISDEVSPNIALNIPLGSVHSVISSQVNQDNVNVTPTSTFDVIVDSGCTRHMFPYQDTFITYKPTPHSYVLLADKSKVPFGHGFIYSSR